MSFVDRHAFAMTKLFKPFSCFKKKWDSADGVSGVIDRGKTDKPCFDQGCLFLIETVVAEPGEAGRIALVLVP
ncbi:MAG TPA: hypothetical protein DIS66_01950 [Candidatus Omnitrophica bacterium]|nr:hypothetical protein [Candidatus Omnitrophota bacterium]